jgi:hypothetical protein
MRKPQFAGQVPAPASEIDAAQNNFAVSLRQVPYLFDDARKGRTPATATHGRDDAERTFVTAAILHFQIRPCAIAVSVDNGGGEKFARALDIADNNLTVKLFRLRGAEDNAGDLRLV